MEITGSSAFHSSHQRMPISTGIESGNDSRPTGDQVTLADNSAPRPGMEKKWTFLLYGAGDNNLSPFIEANVDDMERIGSDANTHIVSQLDLSEGSCRRLYITRDSQPGIHSPVVEDLGPHVDMSNPGSLTDFIVWGVRNFPAEHIALDISDHGGGTAGAIIDDRDGNSSMMTPQDLKKAITDAEEILGRKLDILGFDCCLMASTEVAYELKDTASYLIASEETEGAAGWPYSRILTEEAIKNIQKALDSRITVEPDDLAVKIVKDASSTNQEIPTLSAIRLSEMEDVAGKVDMLAKAILKSPVPGADLRKIAAGTESFSGFRDIYDFTRRIAESDDIKDDDMKAAARGVMKSLDSAIPANHHSDLYPEAHGLHIELPTWGGPSWDYDSLEFSQKTRWAEAVRKIDKK